MNFGRGQAIVGAADHHHRAVDGGKVGSAVGSAHDGGGLADEAVAADVFGHGGDGGDQKGIVEPAFADHFLHQTCRHAAEFTDLHLRQDFTPPRALFRRIGPGRSIDEGETLDPLRRLTPKLERQISAHRQTGQREPGRRLIQDVARHRGKRILTRQVRDPHFGQMLQIIERIDPQVAVA